MSLVRVVYTLQRNIRFIALFYEVLSIAASSGGIVRVKIVASSFFSLQCFTMKQYFSILMHTIRPEFPLSFLTSKQCRHPLPPPIQEQR